MIFKDIHLNFDANQMKNYSALIIDDEPKACRLLNSLIDEFCHEISEGLDCYQ